MKAKTVVTFLVIDLIILTTFFAAGAQAQIQWSRLCLMSLPLFVLGFVIRSLIYMEYWGSCRSAFMAALYSLNFTKMGRYDDAGRMLADAEKRLKVAAKKRSADFEGLFEVATESVEQLSEMMKLAGKPGSSPSDALKRSLEELESFLKQTPKSTLDMLSISLKQMKVAVLWSFINTVVVMAVFGFVGFGRVW
jgi:hypothetical protein